MARGGTGLDQAVAFLTPLGGAAAPTPAAVPWFAAVGAVVGVCVGAVWYWSTEAFGPLVGAALAVVADLVLTGMLHMDGLADAADGLLPHVGTSGVAGAARRLAIMADPSTGAFGTIAVVAAALLRVSALASIVTTISGSVLLVGALWAASRATMAIGLTCLPYARAEGGLATGFTGSDGRPARLTVRNGWHLAISLLALGAAGAALGAWHLRNGLAGFAIGTLCGVGVLALGKRRLGGFTGDVLGASGVVLETVGLVAAAAHWSHL